MKIDPIAVTYSAALLHVAIKLGRDPDDLSAGLTAVADLVEAERELQLFFRTPALSVSAKKAFLDKAFGGKVDDTVLNFLKLLIDKRRIDDLGNIAEQYRTDCNEHHGRSAATVTSAVDLDSSTVKRLAASLEKIEGRPVVVASKVDPDIGGGLVVRLGDRLWDGSVRRRLTDLARLLREKRVPVDIGISG